MKAFAEILSGIVRAGPGTEKYGDDYDFAVAFSVTDGKVAVIKALISPDKEHLHTRVTPAHWLAAARALKRLGLDADWERLRDVKETMGDSGPSFWARRCLQVLKRGWNKITSLGRSK